MNDETFKYFAILLFAPIVLVFQVFIGYMIFNLRKKKAPESNYQAYAIYWSYGLLVTIVIAAIYFAFVKIISPY